VILLSPTPRGYLIFFGNTLSYLKKLVHKDKDSGMGKVAVLSYGKVYYSQSFVNG